MIRMTLVTAITFVLATICAPATLAQICINWLDTCDGLELFIEGNQITGYVRNADCDGMDVPIVGIIQEGIPNPCGPEFGRVGVACDERFGCEIYGDEWYWVLNEKEGNWDLGHVEFSLPPPGACWLQDAGYEILLGPCPFFGPGSGKSLLSTIQAGG